MDAPLKAGLLAGHLVVFAIMTQAQQTRTQGAKPGEPAGEVGEIERQADRAIAQKEVQRAIALLRAGVEHDPGWQQGWWRLGTLLYQEDNYPAAREAFSRLVQLEPKTGAGWTLLGLCDFELRDYGAAQLHLQRGLALGIPHDLDLTDVARYHQSLALILNERYEQAEVVLNSFARAGHHSDEVTLAYGLAALRIPLLPATLSQVMEAERISMIRQVGEAEYLAARQRRPEARLIYDALIARYPAARYLHYAYGAMECNYSDFEKAAEQFRKELQVNPDCVGARLGLAYVGLRTGSIPEALSRAQEAVRLDPKSFVAHLFLGSLLVKLHRLEEGVQELETSRNLEPQSSHVRYALSHAYRRLNRKEDALREQKAFERLRPIESSILLFGQLPASVFSAEETITSK